MAPGFTASPSPTFASQISRPESVFFHSFESSGGRSGFFLSSPAANGAAANAAASANTDSVLIFISSCGVTPEPGASRAAGSSGPTNLSAFSPSANARTSVSGVRSG